MKTIFSLLVFCYCCCSSYAQKRVISEIEFLGGISLLQNNGYLGQSRLKYGSTYGIGLYHPISRHLRLNVQATYDRKGSIFEQRYYRSGGGYSSEVYEKDNTNFRYLTGSLIPVFFMGRKEQFVLGVGGYYSTLLDARISFSRTTSSGTVTGYYLVGYRQNLKDTFKPLNDYGLAITAGYNIAIWKKKSILIKATANLGFADVHCNYIGSQRNKSFALSAGLLIDRKKNQIK